MTFRHAQFHAVREVFTDSINLYLRVIMPDGKRAYLKDLVLIESDEAPNVIAANDVSPISLPVEGAQNLMDELWNCGIRPSEGSGSAGAMRQAEEHIATLKLEAERLYSLLQQKGTD